MDLFKQGLFSNLHLTDGIYKHLDPFRNKDTDTFLYSRKKSRGTHRTAHQAKLDENHSLIHINLLKLETYFKKCKELVDQDKVSTEMYSLVIYRMYEVLSVFLNHGVSYFKYYGDGVGEVDQSANGIGHCTETNKHSYFVWIIWNMLLTHSSDTNFPLHSTIVEMYKLYESNPSNQSVHAYYMIVSAYRIVLNRVDSRDIYISPTRFLKYKRKLYKCFGYLEESIQNKEPRRDMKGRP
jgi:hypothetical protein